MFSNRESPMWSEFREFLLEPTNGVIMNEEFNVMMTYHNNAEIYQRRYGLIFLKKVIESLTSTLIYFILFSIEISIRIKPA